MKNANQPITPCTMQKVGDNEYRASKPNDPKEYNIPMSGLTKRELIAAMAMQGILSGIPQRQQDMVPLLEYYAKTYPKKSMIECVAMESVAMADNLLTELESK